jgi:CcmD family protein
MSRVAAVVVLVLICAAPTLATAAWVQPPEPQEEFIPIEQLPPQDAFPAARLLIGAYVFVPIVLFLYVLSVAKRMSAVQREIERLESDLKRSGRA